VLLIPMLRALRSYEVNGNIELIITQKVVQDLLAPENLINKFIFYDNNRAKGFFRYRFSQARLLKEILGRYYDRLLICESMINAIPALAGIVSAKTKVGYQYGGRRDRLLNVAMPVRTDVHEVERRLDLLRGLGWDVPYEPPSLKLTEEEKANGKDRVAKVSDGQPVVGLHPGCSEALAYKRWPAERFAELMRCLYFEYGVRFVLFGGPGEDSIAEAIRSHSQDIFIPSFVGKLNIRRTAAAIAACDYFISNDSGLMHVAAAVKTPQIVLFGLTCITKNAPQSPDAIVIDGTQLGGNEENSINNISVPHVLEAFEQLTDKTAQKVRAKKSFTKNNMPGK